MQGTLGQPRASPSSRPPEQVFAEYEVEAVVNCTVQVYRQAYASHLLAMAGKIQLSRESLDTLAAQWTFMPREAP